MRFRQTLDIDKGDIHNLHKIINKIRFCKYNKSLSYKPSFHKGYHIILFCDIKCIVCRFVYDDFRRFAYDSNRPEYARNILFEKKERIKIK